MSSRRSRRLSRLIAEAAKFGTVGAVAFVASLVAADGMRFGLRWDQVVAAIAGSAVGTVVSYVGNRNWSFRRRAHRGLARETVLFLLLNAVGIVIQAVTVYAFKHASHLGGGLYYTSANATGLVLGTVFRFWSYRKWVWRDSQPSHSGHPGLEPVTVSPPKAE